MSYSRIQIYVGRGRTVRVELPPDLSLAQVRKVAGALVSTAKDYDCRRGAASQLFPGRPRVKKKAVGSLWKTRTPADA
jgi:hypothetical protein